MSGYRKGRRHWRYGQPRKHHAASRPMTVICPDCGKVGFPDRQSAKQAARQLYPDTLMRVYRCGQWYHMTSQDTETVTRYRQRHAAA